MQTTTQVNAAPTRKVMAASVGTAITIIIIIYLIEAEFSLAIDLPPGVEGAATTLVTFVFGYFVRPSVHDAVVLQQDQSGQPTG